MFLISKKKRKNKNKKQKLRKKREYLRKIDYLIGKKSVDKKFRRQNVSSVINIRHLDKNSSLFTDEIFCRAIYETYYKTLIFPVFL